MKPFSRFRLVTGGLVCIALATALPPAYSTASSLQGSPILGDPITQADLSQIAGNPQITAINTPSIQELSQVTGTVTYLTRLALPPNAVVEVTLAEVSRADAPASILASQTIATEGWQVPIPFQLAYNPNQIQEHLTYVVQARILVAGQLWFINTQRFPVLTQGHGTQVEVVVDPVGGPRP